MRPCGRDAEALEERPNGLAARPQLNRSVVHLLARHAADQLAQHPLMGIGHAVREVIAAVDPSGLDVGQPAVADEVAGELAETLAPAVGKLLVRHVPAASRGLREHLDLHRQRPRRVGRRRRRVVQQHSIVAGQLLRRDVSAVDRPETVIRRAPQIGAIGEAKPDDRLDAVAHERDRLGGDNAGAGGRRCGPVRVDADLFAGLAARDELGDRKEALRRVHARIAGEARIGRIDPPGHGARVPLVDRRVVLDARVGALPRGLGDLAHELARGDRVADRLAGRAGDQMPVLALLDRAHEVVGEAHRVVRVLVLDRR